MKILSLLPSTTEIIYAIGGEDRLVGVTHECDWPVEARVNPQVTSARITPAMESAEIDRLVREQLDESGTLYALDMDLVRSLAPDLVLTQQLCTVCAVGYETVRAAMRSLDDPPEVLNVEPHDLGQVFDSFVMVAERCGMRAEGEQLVDRLRARLDRLRDGMLREETDPPLIDLFCYRRGEKDPDAETDTNSGRRLLFLEWLIPPFSAGHWIPELVEAAGFEPVLANGGEASRQLDWETIRATPFDHLVISCCGFSIERTMEDVEGTEELVALMEERPELSVYVADGNHYFSRPGPRVVDAAVALARGVRGV